MKEVFAQSDLYAKDKRITDLWRKFRGLVTSMRLFGRGIAAKSKPINKKEKHTKSPFD
jgi:hypothetical protein